MEAYPLYCHPIALPLTICPQTNKKVTAEDKKKKKWINGLHGAGVELFFLFSALISFSPPFDDLNESTRPSLLTHSTAHTHTQQRQFSGATSFSNLPSVVTLPHIRSTSSLHSGGNSEERITQPLGEKESQQPNFHHAASASQLHQHRHPGAYGNYRNCPHSKSAVRCKRTTLGPNNST